MIVESLLVGPLQTNAYVLGCEETRDCAVIDPGGDPREIVSCVRGLRLRPVWILDTHGHGDHIGAQRAVKETFQEARIAIHEAEAPMLSSPVKNLSGFFGLPVTSPPADRLLRDGDTLTVGRYVLRVIHAPGHTPGGVAFYVPAPDGADDPPVVFCGDALFAGSIGRVDFPGGNMEQLISSIRDRLLTLPPETIVYPGHGEPTTIGREAQSNPFLT